MARRSGSLLGLLTAILLATQAGAQPADTRPLTERTEKVHLEGRRGESLLKPGYAVAEYTGASSGRAFSRRGLGRADFSSTSFTVTAPQLSAPVSADCAGGESHTRLLWITFEREPLSYVCRYGGGAPANARLALALSKGSFLQRLQQPQRAGELQWGDRTYRAETKAVGGGLPWGGGKVMGYVISRDGVEVAGLSMSGLRPTFYLPPKGSPDRDAAAVLALSLFHFQDPANRNG